MTDFKKSQDLTGQRFGFLYVLQRGQKAKRGEAVFKCICIRDGNLVDVRSVCLTRGKTASCGCLRRENTKKRGLSNRQHGHTSGGQISSEYKSWDSAKQRTSNPNFRGWRNYGGRGIRMCDRWFNGENGKSGFECFLEDMGPRPSLKHSLDRWPDRDGHYEPNNCRWATQRQQMNNTRVNRLITINGRTMTVAEWARAVGCAKATFQGRIKRGWPPERLLLPSRSQSRPTVRRIQ